MVPYAYASPCPCRTKRCTSMGMSNRRTPNLSQCAQLCECCVCWGALMDGAALVAVAMHASLLHMEWPCNSYTPPRSHIHVLLAYTAHHSFDGMDDNSSIGPFNDCSSYNSCAQHATQGDTIGRYISHATAVLQLFLIIRTLIRSPSVPRVHIFSDGASCLCLSICHAHACQLQ